jgi:hypothetical protein
MTSHALRLYVASVTLLVFFVLWAVIAAKPWASTGPARLDPRLAVLDRRQHRLRRESRAVKRELDGRWREYRRLLRRREGLIHRLERRHAALVAAAGAAASASTYATTDSGAAPARVVSLPPAVKVVTVPAATSSGSSRP